MKEANDSLKIVYLDRLAFWYVQFCKSSSLSMFSLVLLWYEYEQIQVLYIFLKNCFSSTNNLPYYSSERWILWFFTIYDDCKSLKNFTCMDKTPKERIKMFTVYYCNCVIMFLFSASLKNVARFWANYQL